MRYLSALILFSALCLRVGAAPAAVQWGWSELDSPWNTLPDDQIIVRFDTTSASPVAVTAGNLLICTIRGDNDQGQVQTLTSTPGDPTWIKVADIESETAFWMEVWILPNAPAGLTEVTATFSSTDNGTRGVLAEYSGTATSDVVDVFTESESGGNPDCGPIVTTVDGCLIHMSVASDGNDDAPSWNAGSGYTLADLGTSQESDSADKIMMQYKIKATAGSTNANMSNVSDSHTAIAVAIKPAGGADTTAPTITSTTVSANGTTVTIVYDENVTQGSGYNDSDLDLDGSVTGNGITMTYSSGDGTDTHVYTAGSTIQFGETVDIDFNGDADSLEDDAGNDLAAVVSDSVTNNSLDGAPTDFWVSTTGTAAWLDAASETDPLSDYCSLATANANVAAGQTVHLIAGTYANDGYINPANSGSSGNLITYVGEGTVTITGQSYAVYLSGDDYIKVDNIDASTCDNFLWIIADSDYNEITNCSFDDNNNADWNHSKIWHSQYNWIHDSQFSKGGSAADGGDDIGSVLDVGDEYEVDDTSYNLIEDNVFFHGGHHVIGLMSSKNVLRNNYFHNEAWTGGYGNRILYGNSPAAAVGGNIIEGNRFGYSAESVDDSYVGGVVLGSPGNIFRYNSIYHSLGYGMALFGYNTFSNAEDNLVYNNTFFNNGIEITGGSDAALMMDDFGFGQTPTGNQIKNNLYYSHQDAYGGSDQGSQTFSNEFDGDLSGDPQFFNANTTPPADKTDATLPDLTLSSASPAIDQGGPLTTVAVADTGSGTSLVVADASYFQDGSYALAGLVDADWIAVGTVANTVQIASISGNTITLVSGISRSDSEDVWLFKDSDGTQVILGSAPDAGAFESERLPKRHAGPTGLSTSIGISPGGGNSLTGGYSPP